MSDSKNENNFFDWLKEDSENKSTARQVPEEYRREHIFQTRDSSKYGTEGEQAAFSDEKEGNFYQHENRSEDARSKASFQYGQEGSRVYDFQQDTGKQTGLNADVKSYVDERIKKSKPRFGFLKALALVVVGALIGSFASMYWPQDELVKEGSKPIEQPANQVNINVTEEQNIESAVAQKAIPSVVGIQVNVRTMGGLWGLEVIEGQAIGSGVIMSEDGLILTNSHVVADAPESGVSILFHDNQTANARVLWQHPTIDLAIVKAENVSGLKAIEVSDSNQVQVGEKAIAIGNPVGLNLQSTLTSGYISGLNRSIQMQNGAIMDGLFQTDAAINSGNSGGALLNNRGQLIGINTAKVQSTDGIGFAIPINVAMPVVDSFIEHGSFETVELGVRGVDLDIYKQQNARDDFGTDKGVVVMDVVHSSNASRAGLKQYDIIVGIDDQSVESMNSLIGHLLGYKFGDTAKLSVVRDRQEMTLNVSFNGRAPNL